MEHDALAGALLDRVGDGRGGEQRLGVGVLRGGEQFGGRGLFDDLPEVHHGDPVGEELDGGQVVGDEQAAEPAVALQVGEQVEDGRLYGDVERGRRFVGDHQIGVAGERTGDGDALALAAGELVRMPVGVLGAQADLGEELLDPGAHLLAPGLAVQLDRFGDDLADGHARVERGRRVLEDQVEVLAQGAHGTAREVGDVGAVDANGAAGRFVEAYGAAADGRLATAGLADEADDLAAADGDRDAVDGTDGATAGGVEVPFHGGDFEHRYVLPGGSVAAAGCGDRLCGGHSPASWSSVSVVSGAGVVSAAASVP